MRRLVSDCEYVLYFAERVIKSSESSIIVLDSNGNTIHYSPSGRLVHTLHGAAEVRGTS